MTQCSTLPLWADAACQGINRAWALQIIATPATADSEFTVQESVTTSKAGQITGFSASRVNQLLASLANAGLVYKNRHGRYSLAVPMLAPFILRPTSQQVIPRFTP